ncbi:MAG: agmatinase [Armatimonadota bacterium]
MADQHPAQVPASAGFAQIPTFLRLPHTRDPAGLDVAILGIPFDSGVVYRPGPRFGPRDIRAISGLIRRYHPVFKISPFDILRVADVGDVDANPYSTEDTFTRVEHSVTAILDAGAVPVCVGGDHSLSLPILRAVARRHGPVGMVHVDSHQDMWDQSFGNRYFHGAPFRRAVEEGLLDTGRVIQIGIRGSVRAEEDFDFGRQHGVRVIRAEEIARHGIGVALEHVRAARGGPLYLSFDIDGVDPAFAPGTGTPEVGGLSSREALEVVRALAGLPIVGADVVEVSPPYDHGNITALLAANLLFEIVSALAVTRRDRA